MTGRDYAVEVRKMSEAEITAARIQIGRLLADGKATPMHEAILAACKMVLSERRKAKLLDAHPDVLSRFK